MSLQLVFVMCKEIYRDKRTNQFLLIPFTTLALPAFPASLLCSVYIQGSVGVSPYSFEVKLLGERNTVVWEWHPPHFVRNHGPNHQPITFDGLALDIPKPGDYKFVLVIDDEVVGRQDVYCTEESESYYGSLQAKLSQRNETKGGT